MADIVFPTKKDPIYALTGLAINPKLQRSGFGSQVLTQLLELYKDNPIKEWICYINQRNTAAQGFFTSNGWKQSNKPIEHKMIGFEYKIIE